MTKRQRVLYKLSAGDFSVLTLLKNPHLNESIAKLLDKALQVKVTPKDSTREHCALGTDSFVSKVTAPHELKCKMMEYLFAIFRKILTNVRFFQRPHLE